MKHTEKIAELDYQWDGDPESTGEYSAVLKPGWKFEKGYTRMANTNGSYLMVELKKVTKTGDTQ